MKLVAVVVLAVALVVGACGVGAPDSGLAGVVLAGPTCPVERVGQPCPDRPVAVHLRAGSVRFASDAHGRFRVALAPGTYTIVNDGGTFPRCRATATVPADAYATITITCDTGIR